MRLKLSYKLFGAFFLIMVIVSCAMLLSRYIFALTFRNYLHQEKLEKLKRLVPLLQQEYRAHGNWDTLKGDPQKWQRLMRDATGDEYPPPPPPFEGMPPNGFKPPQGHPFPPGAAPPGGPPGILLMDARRQAVVGAPAPDNPRDVIAVEADGEVVGWLGMHTHEPFKSGRPHFLSARPDNSICWAEL